MSFEIFTLVQSIRKQGEQFNETDPHARQALLQSARDLVAVLEPTHEIVLRILNNTPTLMASVIIGVNSGLFHALISDGGTPKSLITLAQKTGAEPSFLGRIIRHLAAERLVIETNTSDYAPNAATHMLTTPAMEGMARIMIEFFGRTLPTLPTYLKQKGFKNPVGRSPFQFALDIDEPVFQWALRPGNEEMAQAIRDGMSVKNMAPKWYSGVPVEEVLGHPTDPKAVLLVDVGGNIGNDLIGFHEAFPELPGRLVLEDLPGSVAKLDENDLKPIEVVGHDFFMPQPIKGAKAYYLKSILHDWKDEDCRKILISIKAAMKPGYSKVLINETVIPDYNAGWFDAGQDIMMMLGHGAQERTEREWEELVDSVGLQLSQIWDVKGATEKLIEVELAEISVLRG